jgi:VWFA-related protein
MPRGGLKCLLALLVCLLPATEAQDATFHTTVPTVLAPATVTDKKGHYINGLSAADFIVLDNGAPQTIRVDTTDTTTIPIAIVFAVQADDVSAAAILKIRKIGSTIQPLVTGERGRAAVLAYGSKTVLVQDFTSDPEEISRAFASIDPEDGRTATMLDAVSQSVAMLSLRPQSERRIVVVIGESRDRGSKAKIEEVVKLVQRQSVTVFTVVFSAYLTPFTTKGSDMPPPDRQGGLLDIATELGRLGKTNAATVLASDSGGRKLSFATLRGLEQVIRGVGEELHSQYMISYTAPRNQPGFHRIEVKLRDRADAVIRARPGYWGDN